MRQYRISRSIRQRLLLVFVGIFGAVSFSAGSVSAAPGSQVERITMSPTSRNYTIDAGQTVNDKLTVINDGTTAYDFLVYARPYSVNEQYDPNFTATPKNADAYKWAQFSQTKYHLEPGASVDVAYTMRVPGDAAPGGHYGIIFVETQPSDKVSASSVLRKKRVGSIIYATVKGDYKKEGRALDVSIPFWQLQPPLHVDMKAQNTGNTDFIDATRVTVKDVFGKVKYDETKDYVVLPQTTRRINFDWTQASWFGLYTVEVQQKIMDKTTSTTGYVLMMPRYLPIAFIVVLLIGGVYAVYRHKKQ